MNDLISGLTLRTPEQKCTALRIRLARGIGRGPTELAGLDAALMDAGVANYNLICLSSVIPPGSTIKRGEHHTPPDEYGRPLYVVPSQMRQSTPGAGAHAGVGWVQNPARRHDPFVEPRDATRLASLALIVAGIFGVQSGR